MRENEAGAGENHPYKPQHSPRASMVPVRQLLLVWERKPIEIQSCIENTSSAVTVDNNG